MCEIGVLTMRASAVMNEFSSYRLSTRTTESGSTSEVNPAI